MPTREGLPSTMRTVLKNFGEVPREAPDYLNPK